MQVRICDLGLARVGNYDSHNTGYVTTRWYRAPEVIRDNVRLYCLHFSCFKHPFTFSLYFDVCLYVYVLTLIYVYISSFAIPLSLFILLSPSVLLKVMFTWQHYTKSLDMWSVGCVIAELVLRAFEYVGRLECLSDNVRACVCVANQGI